MGTAAIAFGTISVAGLTVNRSLPVWSLLFMGLALATSASGFGFHRAEMPPSQPIGSTALAFLGVMLVGRYLLHFSGAWRWAYVIAAFANLYLLVFVAIAQLFQRLQVLNSASHLAFNATKLATLGGFLLVGWIALKRSKPARR